MLGFRVASGLFSGSTVTLRTMTSEISNSKTQAQAFAAFAFAGNIAISLAPLEGGLLAMPASTFKVFKHFQPFVQYPYLLPCLVTGSLALSSAVLDFFFLEEVSFSAEQQDSHFNNECHCRRENQSKKAQQAHLCLQLKRF